MTSNSEELQKQLSDLFGSYRAEWLQEKVFDLYTEPRYFPELTTRQSCVLVGGRGTGKTTVLRGLSYLGQYALSQKVDASARQEPQFIGLYHRINTNHVAAFGQLKVRLSCKNDSLILRDQRTDDTNSSIVLNGRLQ